MQEIKTSQAARFYSDYDNDSLQEQPRATVRLEDPCSNMMKAHESAKQMYPHGGSIVNAVKGTSSFPDPTDPNFHPSFLPNNPYAPAPFHVPSTPVPYIPAPLQQPVSSIQQNFAMPQALMDEQQSSEINTQPSSRAVRQRSPSVSSEYGNAYLTTMKKLADASMLPKSELIQFDGNPLRYYIFMKSFENQVEKDTDDNNRRLQLLVQYCTGKAKKVIESCILLSEEEGYKEAKQRS